MPKETSKYIEAVGRRKTSVARVRINHSSKNSFTVNDKTLADYFAVKEHANKATDPLSHVDKKFIITVKTSGGGIASQAEAIRLGLARALIKDNAEDRKVMKKAGFLKRDPRAKERRKFGLKKARKAPQWSKR